MSEDRANDKSGRIEPTLQEKSAMFEWLRGVALEGGKDWRKAAIAMQELNELAARSSRAPYVHGVETWYSRHPDGGGAVEVVAKSDYDYLATQRPEEATQDAENLGRWLESYLDDGRGRTGQERSRLYVAAAEYILARRSPQATQQWIPVTERLPEARYGEEGEPPFVSDDVLIRFEDGYVELANYDHEEHVWTACANMRVTAEAPPHWMPVPELRSGGPQQP